MTKDPEAIENAAVDALNPSVASDSSNASAGKPRERAASDEKKEGLDTSEFFWVGYGGTFSCPKFFRVNE